MTDLIPTENKFSITEQCRTIAEWVGSNVDGLGKVLVSFGIVSQPHLMLVSGLLMSLALKFMDVHRLKELEEDIAAIRVQLDGHTKIEWNESNIRGLFMRLELFMKENFETKRRILKDVIKRFLEGAQSFTQDETAYFMRITTDLTPSDVEYLTWAIQKGRLVKSQEGGIAKRASENVEAKRNLHSLISLGLIETSPVWGGQAYHLTTIAPRYFEFLTGEAVQSGITNSL